MKELVDGTKVNSRTYYYLLDYNDRTNWKYIIENFGKYKLNELNKHEYKELFKKATKDDLNSL